MSDGKRRAVVTLALGVEAIAPTMDGETADGDLCDEDLEERQAA